MKSMEIADLQEALLLHHEAQPLLSIEQERIGSADGNAAFDPVNQLEKATSQRQAERLLLLALDKYRLCLKASPESKDIATQMANLLFQLSNLKVALPPHARVVHLEEAAQLLCSVQQPSFPMLETVRALNAEVDLSSTELLPSDLALLSSCLPAGAALRSLNLSNNSLSNNNTNYSGLQVFASQLRLAKSLQYLVLSRCGLGARGGELLASALSADMAWNCSSVVELDVSENFLGDSSFELLVSALSPNADHGGVYNTTLKSLCVDKNNLGSESLSSLGRMLQGNTSLRKICARENMLLMNSTEEASVFSSLINEIAGVAELDLSCNFSTAAADIKGVSTKGAVVFGVLVAARGVHLRRLDVSGRVLPPDILCSWATQLQSAVASWNLSCDDMLEPLYVNLCGTIHLQKAAPLCDYELLLPAVEVLLEVSTHPGLQIDEGILTVCRNLKHVRISVRGVQLCIFSFMTWLCLLDGGVIGTYRHSF